MKKALLALALLLPFPCFAANGTIVGSPGFGTAKFNDGLISSDDSDYISFPTADMTVTPTTSFTVEAWLKVTGSGTYVAVSMGGTGGTNWWIGVSSGNFTAAFGAITENSGIAINDGNWHHCAFTYAGNGTLATFVDGVAGASVTGTATTISSGGAIGKYVVASGYGWPGGIDEVAFWSFVKYTGSYTVPSSPYAGTEVGLLDLYHLDGNANDSAETSTPTIVPMNSAGIVYSPYNWVVTSGSATTINSGAYFRTIFGGTSVALVTNTANNAPPYSEIWSRIDGDGWTEQALSSGNPVISLASSLPNRYHLVEVILKSTSGGLTRWASNSQTMLTITGLELDPEENVIAPQARSCNILIYGDSITEGRATNGITAPNDTDQNDVLSDYSYALATATNCEVGIVGFNATGILVSGDGAVPALPSSYNYIYSGAPRSFSPTPNLVIYNEGTNDGTSGSSFQTAFETVINGVHSSAPTAKQLLLIPFNQTHIADIEAIVSAEASPLVTYASTAGWFNSSYSSDGTHPYGFAHLSFIAPALFPVVNSLLGTGGGGGSGETVGTFSAH